MVQCMYGILGTFLHLSSCEKSCNYVVGLFFSECVKVSESGEPPVAAVQVEDHERKSKSTKSRKNQQLKPNIEPCVCQDLW